MVQNLIVDLHRLRTENRIGPCLSPEPYKDKVLIRHGSSYRSIMRECCGESIGETAQGGTSGPRSGFFETDGRWMEETASIESYRFLVVHKRKSLICVCGLKQTIACLFRGESVSGPLSLRIEA